MFLRLANSPRHYEWGSLSGISELLGTKPSGRPEAELWFGTHGASPTWLVHHDEGYATLNEFVYAQPERTVSRGNTVPFLLKVLAAARPLSLQAHPSSEQARAGFERENNAGIQLNAPSRNYRDDQAKPELIVSVSREFVALSGFRPLAETLDQLELLFGHTQRSESMRKFIDELSERVQVGTDHALRWAVGYLLTPSPEARILVDDLISAAATYVGAPLEIVATVRDIAETYPSDQGVALAALLNRVCLNRGEAMYLPAGNLHAYLRGVGIELMNSSDNVLRGGLTSKHVDVAELTKVLTFGELKDARLDETRLSAELSAYAPAEAGFALFHFRNTRNSRVEPLDISVGGSAIALCIAGEVSLEGRSGLCSIKRGEAVFISADEKHVTCGGYGEAFIATSVR